MTIRQFEINNIRQFVCVKLSVIVENRK